MLPTNGGPIDQTSQRLSARKRAIKSAIALIVAIAGFTAAYGNLDGAVLELSWNTIDCGGGATAGAGFALSASIGQHDAGTMTVSGNGYQLLGGFWPGAAGTSIDTCMADITGDGIIDVSDLLAVIDAWGMCPVPPADCPADIAPPANGDGTVNVNDLLAVINGWGICPQ